MNKANISGAIRLIKNLEAESQNTKNSEFERERLRREARRLRSVFGLIGVTLHEVQ